MPEPIARCVESWHQHLRGELPGGLDALLADDVVFLSPIVFSPQRGKELTKLYLNAAGATMERDRGRGRRAERKRSSSATSRRSSRAAMRCSSSRRSSPAST
jgi:hypothetical protein